MLRNPTTMLRAAIQRWARLPAVDRFVLLGCLLHPLAWAPVFLFDSAPRVAVTLALTPLGLVALTRLVIRRDAPAIAAALLSVVLVLAACASPAPINALIGSLDWWVGAVGLIAALAWWALGRELTSLGREMLLPALTVGALWNGLVAFAQVVLQVRTGTLASFSGRAPGTMLNPVHYGTFISGVLAGWLMVTARASRPRRIRDAAIILTLAIAAGFSGGRAASLAIGCAVVAAVAVAQRRRVALVHAGLVVAGTAVASLIVSLSDAPRAVSSRIGSAEGGGVRLAVWRLGLEAVQDRPWLGWGPGNVELATERQFDLDYVRRWTTDNGGLVRWTDAHNVLVNMLISVGVIGALIAGAFLVLSVRRLSCVRTDALSASALATASAMAINWMLQPWTVHTIPIALLLLGASMSAVRGPADVSADAVGSAGPPRPVAFRWSAVCGLVLGVALLANLFVVDLGIRNGRLDTAAQFARYGYSDAFVDALMAEEYRSAIVDRDPADALERAGVFARRALDRYPVHNAASIAGENAFTQGDVDAARRFEQAALTFQPWNRTSHRRMLVLAASAGDDQLFAESMRALCQLRDSECDESLAAPP